MYKYLSIFLLLFLGSSVHAQRYKTISGNIKNLKGITTYNVTFDYLDISIHGYASEDEFLTEKMEKRAHKEDAAEKFKEEWFGNRSKYYEPRFLNYINERFENNEIVFQKNDSLKYTMKIKTTWVYPGYLIEPAKISTIVTVFETNNPKNQLVVLEFKKVIGIESKQFNNELSDRISSSYEKLAKLLAIQLKRFVN